MSGANLRSLEADFSSLVGTEGFTGLDVSNLEQRVGHVDAAGALQAVVHGRDEADGRSF